MLKNVNFFPERNFALISPEVRKHVEKEIIRCAQKHKSFYNFESETLFKLGGIHRFPFSTWFKDKLIDIKNESDIELTPNMQTYLAKNGKKQIKEFYKT